MIISIILLVLLLIASVYININLLKKNESLEEGQELIANDYEDLYNKIVQFRKLIEESEQKLKTIDIKGSFESDDEVGFFFKQLKEIQEDIDNFLQ